MTAVSANPATLDLTARKTSAEVYMPYIGGEWVGGDRGAGSGNPALDEDMVNGYLIWKTIYRSYDELPPPN